VITANRNFDSWTRFASWPEAESLVSHAQTLYTYSQPSTSVILPESIEDMSELRVLGGAFVGAPSGGRIMLDLSPLAKDRLAGAPVDRSVERLGAAECGNNMGSARQEPQQWQTHKSSKDIPDSSKRADDNADLPRLPGQSWYGPVGVATSTKGGDLWQWMPAGHGQQLDLVGHGA
jgi:hypothetical protein